MSKHKMTAWAPFGLQPDSLECVIEYTYSAGSPAVYYGTPQPADPASVDFHSVKLVHHQIDTGLQLMLDEWAAEYLSEDYGREKAIDNATDDDR
jgi:hypothetical protein